MKIRRIFVYSALILLLIWGAAYLGDTIEEDSWKAMPFIITIIIVGITLGVIFLVELGFELDDEGRYFKIKLPFKNRDRYEH